MIYVYAITERDAVAPESTGLDEQPLRLVRTSGVAGLYSRHDRPGFAPEPEVLWHHDRIVEAAMALGPVLPARFGTTFADAGALAAGLEPIQDRLVRQLDRVRGCVELAVRVSLPITTPALTPGSGAEYVRAKLALQGERETAAERTLMPLAAHAVSTRRGAASPEIASLTASYLVRASDVPRFADQVRILARRHSELSLSCTGPWPPYSFVGEDEPLTSPRAHEALVGSEAP